VPTRTNHDEKAGVFAGRTLIEFVKMEMLRQGLQAPLIAAPVDAIGEFISTTSSNAPTWNFYEDFIMFLRQALNSLFGLFGFLCVFSCAQDTSCTTSITKVGVPSAGSGVLLEKFSYCGGVLDVTAYIEVSFMS
jgi:hypothetical protein